MNRQRRERAVRDLRSAAGEPPLRQKRPRRRELGAFAGLGRALRRLRIRRGASQRQLGTAAGVTRPMISTCERGSTQPSVATLGRLLDALGVTLGELERALADPDREDDAEAHRAGPRTT